ncbi:MAG: ABC transporter permease [Bdellovibrionales bacterium]|nr:ABC transporter permease [Bdellovibrionales bacterium]
MLQLSRKIPCGPFLALLIVFAIFALIAPPSFSSLRNLETIIRQTSIVGMASLGMTLIIIMGGIDLSVGSLIALSTVVIAVLLNTGIGPFSSALLGIMSAALFGYFNGLLITKLKIVPFITTLGTLLIVRGVAKGLADEQKVDAPMTFLADILARLGPQQSWLLVPPGVWLVLFGALLIGLLLHKTVLGRHIVAVGSNEQAARLCGVPVARVKQLVYGIGGLCAGFAGLLQFSRLTVGDPTVAIGLELDVIAAVVIGGGSLSGGQGSLSGSLIGALIMTIIRSGCSQMGLDSWVQEILTGAIIVGAVWFDTVRRRNA